MSELVPFVSVENCSEAIEFYKEVFQAKLQDTITMLDNIPGMEQYKGKVGHATLVFGESRIFINDLLADYPKQQGNHIQLVFDMETEEKLRNAFQKLAKEGEVVTNLQEVHWGALFGTVKDKYSITWQLYYGHK